MMKVYWNSRKKMWSCSLKGRVRSHLSWAYLNDCTFRVNQNGRKKVVETGVKNVHAFVVGEPASDTTPFFDRRFWTQVRYNPYSMDNFIRVDTLQPVYNARRVFMDAQGQVFADLT